MNIVDLIKAKAVSHPQRKAVISPGKSRRGRKATYHHYTFRQLEQKSDCLAHELGKIGFRPGMKALLFVRPSLDFPVLTFALFKLGVAPVFIDPGMGRQSMLRAVKDVEADALIGVPEIHLARLFFRDEFRSIKLAVSTSTMAFWVPVLKSMIATDKDQVPENFPVYDAKDTDTAAIIFTSGGTGTPKGVTYTHRVFYTQVKRLEEMFSFTEQDIDMPAFPLFAMMTMAMGVSSVVAPMDPSKAAKADPALLVRAIIDQSVTTAGGSPAIWERVVDYCLDNGLVLDSMRALMMFGAPVQARLVEKCAKILPNGDCYTPYGSTECLPVSVISGSEILRLRSSQSSVGKGTCIGKPAPKTLVKIIVPKSGVLLWEACQELSPFDPGEIITCGPQVTPGYHELPQATKESKIVDPQGRLWHRMGDMGYLDDQRRLWFFGRKVHVVEHQGLSHYSVPIEEVFNGHPEVKRTALISIDTSPFLAVERFDKRDSLEDSEACLFKEELLSLGLQYEHSQAIKGFYLHEGFPVDGRHNIKIDRTRLGNYFQDRQERCL